MQVTFADGVQFSSKVKRRTSSMIEHLPEVGSSASSIQASVTESTDHPILPEVGSSPSSIQSIFKPLRLKAQLICLYQLGTSLLKMYWGMRVWH